MFKIIAKNSYWGIKIFLILCFLFFAHYSGLVFPKDSDAAISSAMGLDIASGNIFLKNWFLCTTSFYFTDLFLHGIVYFFTQNMFATAFITGTIIVFMFFTGTYLIYKKISPKDKSFLLFFSLSCFYLSACASYLTRSPSHVATIAFSLFALYFYFSNFRGSKILFALITFMAVSSDKYAVIYVVFPLIIENIIFFVQNKKFERKIIWAVLSLICAAIFNIWVQKSHYIVPGIPLQFIGKESLGNKLAYLFWGPLEYFDGNFWGKHINLNSELLYNLLYSAAACVLIVVQFWFVFRHQFQNRITRTLLISSCVIACSVILINLADEPRYYLGLITNGFILLNVYLSLWNEHFSKIWKENQLLFKIVKISLCVFLILSAFYKTVLRYAELKDLPEKEIADIIKKNNLQYGIASFWNAYNLNLLLNENKLMAIHPNGEKFAWLGKNTWYDRPITFALVNKPRTADEINYFLPEETIYTLGDIKQIIETQKYKIYVYAKPIFINKTKYKANELFANINRTESSDGSMETTDPSTGFLTYGPYIPLLYGKYEADIEYENIGSAHSYFEITTDSGKTTLARQELPEDQNNLSLNFTIKQNFTPIEFRTFYSGKGTLRVKNIQFHQNNIKSEIQK